MQKQLKAIFDRAKKEPLPQIDGQIHAMNAITRLVWTQGFWSTLLGEACQALGSKMIFEKMNTSHQFFSPELQQIISEFLRWTIELISQDGAAIPASGAQRATAQSKWEGSGKVESSTEECGAEAPSYREPPDAVSQETG